MRIVLLAIVFALLGSGVGYWRYREATASMVEIFGIPASSPLVMRTDAPRITPSDTNVNPAVVEVVGSPTYYFGNMQKGTSRNHKFVFRNTGGSPAELEVKSTSCKCTIGSFGSGKDEKIKQLLPGEETEVELTWTAESVLRSFGQTATVLVMPLNQEIQLTVKGFVVESLEFEPSSIELGNFSSKDTVSRQIKLFSNFAAPLEIQELSWAEKNTADRVKLSHVVKKIAEGEDPDHVDAAYVAVIDLEILPGMPPGNLNGHVMAKTGFSSDTFRSDGGTEMIQLGVNVQGRVVSDVRFIGGPSYNETSNVLTVGDVDSEDGKTFKINLVVRIIDDEEVQFKEIEVRPPKLLDVSVGQPTSRNKQLIFPITMEIPKGAAPVDFAGTNSQDYAKITFRTNLPHAPEVPLFLRLKIK